MNRARRKTEVFCSRRSHHRLVLLRCLASLLCIKEGHTRKPLLVALKRVCTLSRCGLSSLSVVVCCWVFFIYWSCRIGYSNVNLRANKQRSQINNLFYWGSGFLTFAAFTSLIVARTLACVASSSVSLP